MLHLQHHTLSALVSLLALSSLAACSMANDPAKVCAAPETQDQVRDLLTQAAIKTANLMKGEAPNLSVSAAQLKPMIKFDLATLTSFDQTTKKTVCSAQVSINVPVDLRQMMTNPLITASVPMLNGGQQALTYTKQPAADGKQFVFSIEQDAQMPMTALAMLAVIMTNKAAATATAAAQQSAIQPPASGNSPNADATASDSAAPDASSAGVQ
jgi:sensor c-di-GMP phosphodiesterase-like protein